MKIEKTGPRPDSAKDDQVQKRKQAVHASGKKINKKPLAHGKDTCTGMTVQQEEVSGSDCQQIRGKKLRPR